MWNIELYEYQYVSVEADNMDHALAPGLNMCLQILAGITP